MKKILMCFLTLVTWANTASAEFSGDVKLACEALLCLSTSYRPGECAPSLARYFGISFKDWSKTVSRRKSFLKLCPTDDGSEVAKRFQKDKLIYDIVNAADRCNTASLNQIKRAIPKQMCDSEGCYITYIYVINNAMPGYCLAWRDNENTDVRLPTYTGNPNDQTGRWVN